MSHMSSDLMFCQKDIVKMTNVCVCTHACVCLCERERECFLSSAVSSHSMLLYDCPRSRRSPLS